MNFKDMLQKMSQLSEATEKTKTGTKHLAEPGGYGRKYDIGADDSDEPKKKRGGQEKDEGPKFGKDAPKNDLFGRTTGKVPAGKKGTQITPMKDADKAEKKADKEAKKKGLKEWMQQLTDAMNEAEQVSIQPAQTNTQVIKQGSKTLGTVTNPQLAAQIKQSIGKGEMMLTPHEQEMAEDGGEKWIQKAIKHPGALTKKAQSAGMSTSAFAKKHAHDSGTTGKQARLAQTLGKMHHEDDMEEERVSSPGNIHDPYGDEASPEQHKAYQDEVNLYKTPGAHPALASIGMNRAQSVHDRLDKVLAKKQKSMEEEAVEEADMPPNDSLMSPISEASKRVKADNKAEKAGNKVTKDLEYDMGHKGKDDAKAERAGKKVAKDIEYDEKKSKKKVKEGMESRLKAAHHAGKSHALGKQNYNCHYDDMEEARMYHEGYKQGLDECYGQMPIQGYVGEESSSDIVDNMASYGAYDELDEVSRGDYLKQQASKPGDTFKAFGQTFHDKDVLENSLAFESWDNQLNSLLTEYQGIQEGMTVSISKGQQGTPDSVSVSAQDSEAEQLLNIIKHAGLGLFGGDEGNKSSPMSVVAGNDEPVSAEIDVVNDHDGMMDLIKKVTGGSVGPQGGEIAASHDHGEDYEEEGDEETCNECGMYESDCGCDHEQVDEVESEDQMTYQVAEDNPPDSGAAEVDAEDASVSAQNADASSHGGATNSNLEEDEEECSHCHKSPCECEHGELEESLANGADDTFETDADFMINDITSGLNKRKSTGQTTIPVIAGQKSRMHSHNTTDVSEAINDWKALAGIR